MSNECPTFENLIRNTWSKLEKKMKIDRYKGDLESATLDVYFKPSENFQALLEVVKSFALQLVIRSCQDRESAVD